MDKIKGVKLGGLLGLAAAVGYGLYLKRKEKLEQEQEVIDITPEISFEEEDTRK